MANKSEDTTITVRLDSKLLDELEREREQFQREHPGVSVSLSDVVRTRIIRGGKEVGR